MVKTVGLHMGCIHVVATLLSGSEGDLKRFQKARKRQTVARHCCFQGSVATAFCIASLNWFSLCMPEMGLLPLSFGKKAAKRATLVFIPLAWVIIPVTSHVYSTCQQPKLKFDSVGAIEYWRAKSFVPIPLRGPIARAGHGGRSRAVNV